MKKYFSLIIAVAAFFAAANSSATCLGNYHDAITELREKNVDTTKASFGIGLAMLIFPPAGIAKLGAYSVRGVLTFNGTKRFITIYELENMKNILMQTNSQDGKEIEFVYSLVKESYPQATISEVAQKIKEADRQGIYCANNQLMLLKELLVSLGVSEEVAEVRAKYFYMREARFRPQAEVHPLIGH